MPKFNVNYYDEYGNCKQYLTDCVPTRREAEKWCDKFNERYRKPYLNGKGYYAGARVIQMPE